MSPEGLINVHHFRQRLKQYNSIPNLCCGFPIQLLSFSQMQFWNYLVTRFMVHRAFRMLIFCTFFFISWTWWPLNHLKFWLAVCPLFVLKSCSWGYVSLFQLPHLHFRSLFILRGKKEHLVFGDLLIFFMEEICKNTLKSFAVAANTLGVFKCSGKIRHSWGRGFRNCTEKKIIKFKLLKRQPLSAKVTIRVYLHDSSYARSSGSKGFELLTAGKCRKTGQQE